MSHEKPPSQPRKRAPIAGITRDAMKVYSHRPRSNYLREPMTVAEGLARWLDAIGWVIDAPFPAAAVGTDPDQIPAEQLPLHRVEINEPGIVAEYLKNVVWGLTFEDLFSESNSVGSLVGFASDGGTVDKRVRASSLLQQSIVRVLVDSARPRTAMDVAMRLWDFFRTKPGFQVESTKLNQNNGGRVKVRRPDFTVREASVLDEPTYLAVGADEDRSQVTFRLHVKYIRH